MTQSPNIIIQEVEFDAPPARIYEALMNAEQHAAFTGAPATSSAEPGGAWTAYGGAIHGRNIELIPNQRIVQAWRPGNWPAGQYSLVQIELEASGAGTKLVLTHSGIPPKGGEHLAAGWHDRYWKPLREWLGSKPGA